MKGQGEALRLSRLVYLVAKFKVKIPRALAVHVPGGDWLQHLYKGPGSTGIDLGQFRALYQEGATLGEGSHQEAVMLLGELVDTTLTDTFTEPAQKIKVYALLDNLITRDLIEYNEIRMSEPSSITHIEKFDTGFIPLDLITGGLYQGIVMFVGKPGTGKTSLMITLMEAVAISGATSSTLFIQNEIPSRMMEGRIAGIRARTTFREQDRIICASWSAAQICEHIKEHPDPDQLLIFDSPDVAVVPGVEGVRFGLYDSYRNLVRAKPHCRMIATTSQARRKDRLLTQESVAEAWSKAWLADMIIGLNKVGESNLRLSVLKNRFGPTGNSIIFLYNYADLTWELDQASMADEWE